MWPSSPQRFRTVVRAKSARRAIYMINLRTSLVFCIFVATFSLNDGDNLLDRIVY